MALPKPNKGLTDKQWKQVEKIVKQKASKASIEETDKCLKLFDLIEKNSGNSYCECS